VAAAVVLVILNPPRATGGHRPAAQRQAALRHVHPYRVVRPGDTYAEISMKTGLTVAQLQAFNRDVDPLNLIPGERLNLWRRPPKPRPSRLGRRSGRCDPGSRSVRSPRRRGSTSSRSSGSTRAWSPAASSREIASGSAI